MFIIGKPGIGKTTFLKYLIVQCVEQLFQIDKTPIFIQLSQFALELRQQPNTSDGLFNYIYSQYKVSGILQQNLRLILEQGKALLCLDGLDEVLDIDSDLVIHTIQEFIRCYGKNSFIISCRVASRKYHLAREGFIEYEMADFNQKQKEPYIRYWLQFFQQAAC